jgi:hypothetical protein
MPYDRRDHFDDEDAPREATAGRRRRFHEFDCPECSANNPFDDGFGDGDEVLCAYCGEEFKAKVSEEGTLRLRLT